MCGCTKTHSLEETVIDTSSILSTDSVSESTVTTTITADTSVPESSETVPSETSMTATTITEATTVATSETTVPSETTKTTSSPKSTIEPEETTKKLEPTKAPARGAIRDAIQDHCGSHSGFVFDDRVMSNEKARAKYSAAINVLGHIDIPGTVIPLEACGGVLVYYDANTDVFTWQWTDHSGTNHTYDNAYDCFYAYATFLVTEHTTQLSSDSEQEYFGYGASIYTRERRTSNEYRWGINVYIGAESEIGMALNFPS